MMNEPDSVKIDEFKLARAESWKPFALAALIVAVITAVVNRAARGGHQDEGA
jgi:hypothetical protein